MNKKILVYVLFSLLWFSSFGQKGAKPAAPTTSAGGGGAAASGGGGSAAAPQIQPGYHYFINNLKICEDFPFIRRQYKLIKYTTTTSHKVPCRSCSIAKNTPHFILKYNDKTKKYDRLDSIIEHRTNKSDTIIRTNAGKKITDTTTRKVKDTIISYIFNDNTLRYRKIDTAYKKTTVTKYTDTCSSYICCLVGKNDTLIEIDTMVTVTEVDTISKYLPKITNIFNHVAVGIIQDSGKLQLLLNGNELPLSSISVAERIDSIKKRRIYESIIYDSNEINALNFINDTIYSAIYEYWFTTAPFIVSHTDNLELARDYNYNRISLISSRIGILYSELDSSSYIKRQEITDSINNTDTLSDSLKSFLIKNLYRPWGIVEVDSSKDSCKYCGHSPKSDSVIKVGAYLYKKSRIWKCPVPISKNDSINNFYVFIKKRNKVSDPIYVYRIPFARWEAGAVNIPFQFTPGHNNVALNSVSTSFINVNAFFGRAWGNTKFYYDPAKTHTAFTGMLSVFAGVGQLPALAIPTTSSPNYYNLTPSAASLAGTSQLGFAFGMGGTVTIDIFDLGLFAGNTLAMGSKELVNGWYGENKWWVGLGLGLNIGIFNNLLTNPWE